MDIAIISDTHMPRRGRALPAECRARLSVADLIVHAGDISTLAELRDLEQLGRVIAVHGNVDEAALQTALPVTAQVSAGGHKIAIVHDAGPVRGRIRRLRRRFPDAEAVIFGHSHMPLHERAPDGFQMFNPGSPTEKRRAPHHTMGIARADADGLRFELVELD